MKTKTNTLDKVEIKAHTRRKIFNENETKQHKFYEDKIQEAR